MTKNNRKGGNTVKVFIVFLTCVVCILALSIFRDIPDDKKLPELVISPYLFDESVTDPNDGTGGTAFAFEPLAVGEVRLMAPVIGTGVFNLGFFFEFEGGVVEVVSESKDVQLSTANADEPWRESLDLKHRIFDYRLRVASEGYMSANPLGSGCGYHIDFDGSLKQFRGAVGKEYYLAVKAYEFSNENSPVITARLKLTQLEDHAKGTIDPDISRFFSIELVSYEYSETYEMQQESGLFNRTIKQK